MIINDLLEKVKMSKYRLSETSGIPYTTISDICKGKVHLEKCSGETLYKLAKAFNVSIEDLIGNKVERNMEKRSAFTTFKSNMCHRLKYMGDLDFIIWILEDDLIRHYFEKEWYRESLYLLAMVDYLSKENSIPLCDKYDDIRGTKLEEPLFPSMIKVLSDKSGDKTLLNKCMDEAIPEFKKYNIIEGEIRDVC